MHLSRTAPLTAGLASLALAVSACGGDSEGSTSETIELKATNLLPPNDAQSEMIQWFMDELEARTDGAVQTEVVHAGALIPGADTLPGLKQGRADAGNVVHAYFPAELPLANINVVPVEADQSARLRAFQDVADNVEAWQQELEANGLELIGFLPNTSSTATFGEPITSLADVDGLKLRVSSQTMATVWQEFGAEPIFMPVEEVYEAVERGIVDGTLYPMGTQISTGIIDVAKTMTPDAGQNGSGTFAFSSESYDALPQSAKDVIEELKGEWYAKTDEMLTKYEAEACEEFLAADGKILLWSEEEQAALNAAIPLAAEVWRTAAVDAGVGEASVDEVWETFNTSLTEHNGTTDYTDGLRSCADQQ